MTYQRNPITGDISLAPAPPQVWTSDQWTAEIKIREYRLAQKEDQLASSMAVKDKPDQATLDLWNSMAVEQRRPQEEEVGRLQADLAEMKAV